MTRSFPGIIILLALFSANISAASWYEVEVYVFKRQAPPNEHWPVTSTEANIRGAIDLITPALRAQTQGPLTHQSGTQESNQSGSQESVQENAQANLQEDAQNSVQENAQESNQAQLGPVIIGTVPVNIGSNITEHERQGESAVLLPSSKGEFASMISQVSRQRGNQSLLHMTWQQPMYSRNRARPLRIYAGVDYSNAFQADGEQILRANPDQQVSSPSIEPESRSPHQPLWELDGTMTLSVNHYLFVKTDLRLRVPDKRSLPEKLTSAFEQEASEQELQQDVTMSPPTPFLYSLPFVQARRVRSEEINYFDHPQMGIILQIRKIPQPTAQTTQEEQTVTTAVN